MIFSNDKIDESLGSRLLWKLLKCKFDSIAQSLCLTEFTTKKRYFYLMSRQHTYNFFSPIIASRFLFVPFILMKYYLLPNFIINKRFRCKTSYNNSEHRVENLCLTQWEDFKTIKMERKKIYVKCRQKEDKQIDGKFAFYSIYVLFDVTCRL